MANIGRLKLKKKQLLTLILAVFVIAIFGIFLNQSSYNLIKSKLVKNSNKYLEMYAYSRSKPTDDKYFVLQGNDVAKSFFRGEMKFVMEGELGSINCSEKETVLIYEKPSDKVKDFVAKKKGESFVLNKGTAIEFYTAKIPDSGECKVEGN